MTKSEKFTVYVSPQKGGQDLVKKLLEIAKKRDRALNYIVVEALIDYVAKKGP